MHLAEKERIVGVEAVVDTDHLGVLTRQGQMLLFPAGDLRPMGKTAGGVRAIELLEERDEVVHLFLHKDEPFILVHSDISGKLLSLEDLRIWKRAKK